MSFEQKTLATRFLLLAQQLQESHGQCPKNDDHLLWGYQKEDFEPTPLREQPQRLIYGVHLESTLSEIVMSASSSVRSASPNRLLSPVGVPKSQETKRRRMDSDDYQLSRFSSYQQHQWDIQFTAILDFKRKYGHCNIPHTFEGNPSLSRWVKRQRHQYKLYHEGNNSTLTASRIMELDTIGFVWNSHDAAWQERYRELELYHMLNGHCNVPATYPKNPRLSTWVKCQRRQYKLFCSGEDSFMTVGRIKQLDALGFQWDRSSRKRL